MSPSQHLWESPTPRCSIDWALVTQQIRLSGHGAGESRLLTLLIERSECGCVSIAIDDCAELVGSSRRSVQVWRKRLLKRGTIIWEKLPSGHHPGALRVLDEHNEVIGLSSPIRLLSRNFAPEGCNTAPLNKENRGYALDKSAPLYVDSQEARGLTRVDSAPLGDNPAPLLEKTLSEDSTVSRLLQIVAKQSEQIQTLLQLLQAKTEIGCATTAPISPPQAATNAFIHLPMWITRMKLSSGPLHLLLVIHQLAERRGHSYASRSTLAKMCNIKSLDTIAAYLAELEAKGLVTIQKSTEIKQPDRIYPQIPTLADEQHDADIPAQDEMCFDGSCQGKTSDTENLGIRGEKIAPQPTTTTESLHINKEYTPVKSSPLPSDVTQNLGTSRIHIKNSLSAFFEAGEIEKIQALYPDRRDIVSIAQKLVGYYTHPEHYNPSRITAPRLIQWIENENKPRYRPDALAHCVRYIPTAADGGPERQPNQLKLKLAQQYSQITARRRALEQEIPDEVKEAPSFGADWPSDRRQCREWAAMHGKEDWLHDYEDVRVQEIEFADHCRVVGVAQGEVRMLAQKIS